MKQVLPLVLTFGLILLLVSVPLAEDIQYTASHPNLDQGGPPPLPMISPDNDEDVYSGQVRVFLVEPLGRWTDYDGTFYKNVALDIPIVENVTLNDGDIWYQSVFWDAANSPVVNDISNLNIKAVTAVFNSTAIVKDADQDGGGYYYQARYVDICAEAFPWAMGVNETAPGYTHKVFLEDLTAQD